MSQGWIKLHRKLREDDLWYGEPFTRGQAWTDLILLAKHKDGHMRIDGQCIDLKRGQLGFSILTLSKLWKWSRGKTRRFLKELEKHGKILLKTDTRNSIITICNYATYQSDDTTRDTTRGTTRGTTDGHKQEGKEGKERERKKEPSQDFKNLTFEKKYLDIALAAGMSEQLARSSWERWKLVRATKPPVDPLTNWELWASREKKVDSQEAPATTAPALPPEDAAIAKLGALKFKKKIGQYISKEETKLLADFEKSHGEVWWDNIEQHKERQAKGDKLPDVLFSVFNNGT